jgi:hypothetical protein
VQALWFGQDIVSITARVRLLLALVTDICRFAFSIDRKPQARIHLTYDLQSVFRCGRRNISVSPDKRPCGHRWDDTSRIVGNPEAILKVTD